VASKNRVLIGILTAATLAVGTFPFLAVPEDSEGILVFLGRFHPVLLHFPIVLILLTLIFEALNTYRQWSAPDRNYKIPDVSPFVGPLLLASALTTLVTVIGGYLLFRSGEYQGLLVNQHLWGGVVLTISLNLAAALYLWDDLIKHRNARILYRGALLTAAVLVMVTSHLGGTLTHGQDFLTEHMPSLKAMKPSTAELKEPKDLLVFEDLVMPIFEDKCQSCHNQYKTKGGFLMTSLSNISKGGDSEKPMLVAFQPAESELYHRITLPDDDDDKMPPPEKSPLSEQEIQLIAWWISQGAEEEMLLGANPPDSISRLLESYLPRLFQNERLKMRQEEELDALSEELGELGNELGLVIEPDPENHGFFTVSMTMPPTPITNKAIRKLVPYAPLFTKISLPGADVDDDALFEISKMSNLQGLFLPKTQVNGQGLAYLSDLDQLTQINLSHSELNNDGILNLIHLPSVETVYIWGSETDTLVIKALRSYLPETKILEEEGAYF